MMTSNKTSITAIINFWEWFARNCRNFGANFENAHLLGELDAQVKRLGSFSWEIGPGKTKDHLLVISPSGDVDMLQETKIIIDHAIACDGWEYYYAKQPKQWDLRFFFVTGKGARLEVDAAQWEYVLLRFEDGMFTIIIKASDLQHLDENDKLTAVEIALDGMLGEELRLQTFCEIDVRGEFDSEHMNKASNMRGLAPHIKKLSGNVFS